MFHAFYDMYRPYRVTGHNWVYYTDTNHATSRPKVTAELPAAVTVMTSVHTRSFADHRHNSPPRRM